jgi:DDE family transposase
MYQSESLANNQKDSFNLKAKCTTSDHGRVLYRHFDEDFYDRVRRYQGTKPYEKALRKRAVWVESLFGEAKDWHGMDRFRLRRLKTVNIEALMVAVGQNTKRLVASSCGRGPKPVAQVMTLRLLEPSFCYPRSCAQRHHCCIPRHTRRSFSTVSHGPPYKATPKL